MNKIKSWLKDYSGLVALVAAFIFLTWTVAVK
jgi:hypothetical protein